MSKEFSKPLFLLFAAKFVKYGISGCHMKLMADMKLYRSYVLHIVEKRIARI
jgi:hypothetical protein